MLEEDPTSRQFRAGPRLRTSRPSRSAPPTTSRTDRQTCLGEPPRWALTKPVASSPSSTARNATGILYDADAKQNGHQRKHSPHAECKRRRAGGGPRIGEVVGVNPQLEIEVGTQDVAFAQLGGDCRRRLDTEPTLSQQLDQLLVLLSGVSRKLGAFLVDEGAPAGVAPSADRDVFAECHRNCASDQTGDADRRESGW